MMKHLSKIVLLSAIALGSSFALAQNITPTRVGPVSQYGQLMTGKNSQGQGRIYGSCEGVKDGAEVQVRGMSLYWSLMPQAVEFWSEEGVSTMVRVCAQPWQPETKTGPVNTTESSSKVMQSTQPTKSNS